MDKEAFAKAKAAAKAVAKAEAEAMNAEPIADAMDEDEEGYDSVIPSFDTASSAAVASAPPETKRALVDAAEEEPFNLFDGLMTSSPDLASHIFPTGQDLILDILFKLPSARELARVCGTCSMLRTLLKSSCTEKRCGIKLRTAGGHLITELMYVSYEYGDISLASTSYDDICARVLDEMDTFKAGMGFLCCGVNAEGKEQIFRIKNETHLKWALDAKIAEGADDFLILYANEHDL